MNPGDTPPRGAWARSSSSRQARPDGSRARASPPGRRTREQAGIAAGHAGRRPARDVTEALAAAARHRADRADGVPGVPDPRGAGERALPARRARASRSARTTARSCWRWPIRSTVHDRRVRVAPAARCCRWSRCPPTSTRRSSASTAPASRRSGQIVGEVETRRDETHLEADVEQLKDLACEAPVIRLVNLLITRAVESARLGHPHRAVRERAAGPLPHRRRAARGRVAAAAAAGRDRSRASRSWRSSTSPSAGCRRTAASGCASRARRSTSASRRCPTLHGESVVMRILDRGGVVLDLERLGFDAGHARARSCELLQRPNGIMLVTGPTGSGKTTTLYARARHGSTRPDEKIITVEDPVEYQLRGRQPDPGEAADRPHLRERAALDRAPGPRRHHGRRDPRPRDRGDRDPGGAHRPPRALDAAHQRRAGAVTALLDMGVEDYLLASSVIGVLAQRLVRKLCPAVPRAATRRCPRWSSRWACAASRARAASRSISRAAARHCSGTGYFGRDRDHGDAGDDRRASAGW